MGEIATRGMIRLKSSSFPEGNDNECMTKAEILSLGGGNLRVNGNYGNNECPVIDDVVTVSDKYIGYKTSDGQINYLMPIFNGARLPRSVLNKAPEGSMYVFIFTNSPEMADIEYLNIHMEALFRELWLKMPGISGDNSEPYGSCTLSAFGDKYSRYRIDDTTFYTNFFINGIHMQQWEAFRTIFTGYDYKNNEIYNYYMEFSKVD